MDEEIHRNRWWSGRGKAQREKRGDALAGAHECEHMCVSHRGSTDVSKSDRANGAEWEKSRSEARVPVPAPTLDTSLNLSVTVSLHVKEGNNV